MTLTSEQLSVVNLVSGRHLVLAPPGSGKTEMLSQRIIRALDSGVDPEKMLCATFTNRAAFEMRDRVAGAAGQDCKLPGGGIAENVAILVRTNREADDCERLVRGLGYRTVKVSGRDLFAYPLMRDFLAFVSLFVEKPPRTAWVSLVRRFADGIYRSSEARYFVRLESIADAEHEETIRAILTKKDLPDEYERRLRRILLARAKRIMNT